MKSVKLFDYLFALILLISCNHGIYQSNGESIYKTGKNLEGERMLNKEASRIKIVNSCQTCHGKMGDRMKSVSIAFSFLADPGNFQVPYTDSLLYRFLDHDLKSDGSKADIGVIWKMSEKDKRDLVEYLKKLKP